VTLVGLVSKNGILIVEFANKQQLLGMSKIRSREGGGRHAAPTDLDDHGGHRGRSLSAQLVTGPGAVAQ